MGTYRGSTSLLASVALIALLVLAWVAYHPGLVGGFLFDDFANLPSLGAFGPVDNPATFWRYLTSGSADPTGRPLALLSFLIDANDWPADPYPFKRTSLLLHLLNGAVLTWLLLKLGRAARIQDDTANVAAILGAALWLLHPLFLSTTLYVVQRETVLAATFTLIGLLGYISGRELAVRGKFVGVCLSALSIASCTLLAVSCKANGALLPMLALVIDAIALAPFQPQIHPRTRRGFAVAQWLLVILPSALLATYLVRTAYVGFTYGLPSHRAWTLGERLLSESRILFEYLGLLWLPRAFSIGLFNDNISVSTGLFSPPSTLFCCLAILGLITVAWRWRKRHFAFALAVLFFFAGHLLESTVVPLELYFEHRNYLPAALMFWPLSLWICAQIFTVEGKPTYVRVSCALLAVTLPLSLAALTYLGANLWGDVRDQALVWAARNPHSARAQANAAQIEVAHGETAAAIVRLEKALGERPNEVQLALNLIGAKCQAKVLTPADIDRAAQALKVAPNTGRMGYEWFERSIPEVVRGRCAGLTLSELERLLQAIAENAQTQKVPGRVQDRLHLQARIALLRGDRDRALRLFDAALDADARPAAALNQAAILGTAGQPDLGLHHLDHLLQVWHRPTSPGWSMQSLHAWLLSTNGYWDYEIAHLRATLQEDQREAEALHHHHATG